MQLFTGGLLPPLSLAVQVHNSQSLAAAMSLARQMELMEQYTAAPPDQRFAVSSRHQHRASPFLLPKHRRSMSPSKAVP